jgi:HSP20 family molecular chaperone IbpA
MINKFVSFGNVDNEIFRFVTTGIENRVVSENHELLTADLPGYNKSNISVKYENKLIKVVSKKENEDGKSLYVARVKDKVEVSNIKCKIEDGILTITMPYKSSEKAIEVQIE